MQAPNKITKNKKIIFLDLFSGATEISFAIKYDDKSIPSKNPKVGLKMYKGPPPYANIGRPDSPSNMYDKVV